MSGGPLQVVFSFDTTGSMSGALTEVRGRLSDMLQRLQTDLPQVSTAVVAHGDYCDEKSTYLTKHMDFSRDLPKLVDFVNKVKTTGGGDEPEAYEVMLRLVRTELAWTPGSNRVLVVIGDAFPHPASDPQNKQRIDWKEECRLLQAMGVKIYGAQVNNSAKSTEFFKTMTDVTDGQHLQLSQFGTLCDVIMAICYREKGAEFLHSYEAEVRAREGRMALHKDLEGVFGVLRRADSSASSSAAPALTKRTSLTKASRVPSLAKAASVSKTTKTGTKPAASTTAKKLVARASKAKATKATGKRASTPRIIVPRKLNREMVCNSHFRLKELSWSPWKLAAVPVADGEEEAKAGWRRCLGGAARQRPQGAGESGGKRGGKVLCEAAVQTRPGARRHVLWCRLLPLTSSATPPSLSRLMAAPSMRAQLTRVMRSGCRMWLRWAKVRPGKAEDKVKQEVKDVYDYAWCSRKGCRRDVWVPSGSPSHRMQVAEKMV